MTEPTGYVLTPALDGPDMIHLDPDETTRCGGREWGKGTLGEDSIVFETIDENTAEGMLDAGLAIACRRCGLKDRAAAVTPPPADQEVAG